MLSQYDEMLSLYGRQTGVNLARKHIGWYTKGLPGSAELRNTVNQQDESAVVVAMLREFYAPWVARKAALPPLFASRLNDRLSQVRLARFAGIGDCGACPVAGARPYLCSAARCA
jgi:hypothetical protein